MSRWYKKSIVSILMMTLCLFNLGCQAVTEFAANLGSGGTPEIAKDWPHSTFVPLRESIQVEVEQPLSLESHHISPNGMAQLKIFVNDDPVKFKASSEQGTIFSNESGDIQIMVNAQHSEANAVKPEYPNSDWTVSLIWIGDVPGTYDLSLVAIDVAQNHIPPVTQRIEVK
jgi:hypothetical protein